MGWVLILAVLVWPPVHLILQRTAGVSPWKLFGLGMFSTPGGMDGLMHLGVIVIDGDPHRLDAARAALAEAMTRDWSVHRAKMGELARREPPPLDFVLVDEAGVATVRLPRGDERLARSLTRARDWASAAYVRAAARTALSHVAAAEPSFVVVLITRQRMNVSSNELYGETQVHVHDVARDVVRRNFEWLRGPESIIARIAASVGRDVPGI